MLGRPLIMGLLIGSLTGWASVMPTALVAQTPQTRTETSVAQHVATGIASPATARGDLRLTILYDNTATDSRLRSDWGFAALFEYCEYSGHRLLFDTGASGAFLLNNMRQLGVEPQSIEAVIFSHEHRDHTGGLQVLLDTGIRPTVYAPFAFSHTFKEQVRARTTLVEVTDALTILPGMHLTRPLGAIVEQALAVETRDGTAVITGYAHPGNANMVRQAQEVVSGKMSLLAGGPSPGGRRQEHAAIHHC